MGAAARRIRTIRRWRRTAGNDAGPPMIGPLQHERLLRGRRPHRVGRRIVLCGDVTSTNDEAWACLDDAASDGTAVLAEYQSQGRGRLGRRWESPRGASVMCSVLLVEPPVGALGGVEGGSSNSPTAGPAAAAAVSTDPAGGTGVVSLLAAIACYDAISRSSQVACQIQWPNDLVARGRKLAGVLIERRRVAGVGCAYVVGIGINCLQHAAHFDPAIREQATSLDLESVRSIDRHRVARALLDELDRWFGYARPDEPGTVRRDWLRRAAPLGRRVRLRHDGADFSGQVVDVDPLAHLVVQLDEGGRRLFQADDTTVVHYGDREGSPRPDGPVGPAGATGGSTAGSERR